MPATGAAPSTRARLLSGAAEVFARKGLNAATTREIAQAAGVNEVTLFRHFQSKQRLLAAVIENVFAEPADDEPLDPKATLPEILRNYATSYSRRFNRNVALVRVLVGEIQHCDEQERRIVREVFRPKREEFLAALRRGQDAGQVRTEANLQIITDQFGAMIFTGVLKASLPGAREYSAAQYLEACVETMTLALTPTRRRGS